MLKQLFINSTILISAFFIMGQHFAGKQPSFYHSRKFKLAVGAASGLTGSILIFFGIQLPNNVILDFRYVSIIVSTMIGGPTASICSGIIIAIFRVLYKGTSYASLVAVFFIASAVAGCSIISRIKKGKRRKWILMVVYCLINSFFALRVVMPDSSRLVKTLIPYYLLFIAISLVVYYCSISLETLSNAIRKLRVDSAKDYLTELNNVRNFDILYNNALINAQEKQEHLSLVVIDIDHFKRVNDTHGHLAGDAVLRQLGELLKEGCRGIDIVSRNGGEEFSIILIDCPMNIACLISERIRKRVEAHKFELNDDTNINITISSGIATYPDSANDNESLFKNADSALYEAKNSGRNKVCCYGSECFTSCELNSN